MVQRPHNASQHLSPPASTYTENLVLLTETLQSGADLPQPNTSFHCETTVSGSPASVYVHGLRWYSSGVTTEAWPGRVELSGYGEMVYPSTLARR